MKAAPESYLKDPNGGLRMLHTGQHYSDNMAGASVKELDLPRATMR